MFRAFVGDFDYESLDSVGEPYTRILCMVLLSFFLLIGLIVLFNVLIAMMATTYEKVNDAMAGEFTFGRSKTIWEMDEKANVLFPPSNIIVHVLSLFMEVITCCYCSGFSRKSVNSLKDFDTIEAWHCRKCHAYNKPISYKKMLDMIEALLKKHDVDGNLTDDQWKPYLPCRLVVCQSCYRHQCKFQYDFHRRRENVGFFVFLMFLYVPMLVLIALPSVLLKGLNSIWGFTNIGAINKKAVGLKTFDEYMDATAQSRGDKGSWVKVFARCARAFCTASLDPSAPPHHHFCFIRIVSTNASRPSWTLTRKSMTFGTVYRAGTATVWILIRQISGPCANEAAAILPPSQSKSRVWMRISYLR